MVEVDVTLSTTTLFHQLVKIIYLFAGGTKRTMGQNETLRMYKKNRSLLYRKRCKMAPPLTMYPIMAKVWCLQCTDQLENVRSHGFSQNELPQGKKHDLTARMGQDGLQQKTGYCKLWTRGKMGCQIIFRKINWLAMENGVKRDSGANAHNGHGTVSPEFRRIEQVLIHETTARFERCSILLRAFDSWLSGVSGTSGFTRGGRFTPAPPCKSRGVDWVSCFQVCVWAAG